MRALNSRLVKLCAAGIAILALALSGRLLIYKSASQPYDPSTLYHGIHNAPFIKSPDTIVEQMVELAEVGDDDRVVDLGCGDGRIIITAALMTGCRGIGFDIDPDRVTEARSNVQLHHVEDRVSIVKQDIFTIDLSEVDVAMMYLLPWMMDKLVPQFEKMKPGSRIVSHEYWIAGVEPDRIVEVPVDPNESDVPIYLYVAPLKKNPELVRGGPPPEAWKSFRSRKTRR